MFGQNNNSPFGAAAPTPFGSTPNTTPAFGSTAPATPFGGGSAFGAPATTPFGSPPAPAFGSGFGAPAPSAFGAPAPSAFGAPAPATTSPFGAPSPSPFGAPTPSTSLFGAPAPAPSTGLFGAPAPSAFGAPAPSAFGTPAPSPFGAPSAFGAPAPSAFGSTPAPTGGLFGTPAPTPFGAAPRPFGAPSPAPSTGLFGSAPAPTPGVFGAAPAASGGTKVAPFQATTRQDGSTTIHLQSITAMPQYESKSFEELRFEDYQQGNKGDASAATGGAFGAPSAFGAPAASPFGAPAPSPFGAPAAPAPSMFGASAPSPFGAPATSAFGTSTPAFGSPSPAPAFGFGSTPAPAFGKAPAPSTGLFGSPAPAPGGLFGSTAPSSGIFGTSPAPAFGAPAPATGLFGSTPAAAFGSPAPAPSLFGTPAPAPSLFGTPAPAPSMFGAPAPAPAFGAPSPSTGLFGAPAPGTGLFGAKAPAPLFGAPTSAPSFGFAAAPPPAFGAPVPAAPAPPAFGSVSVIPPATDAILTQQLAALDNQRKELEKMTVWRSGSDGKDSSNVVPQPLVGVSSIPVSPYNGMSQYKASPKSAAKIRPRGFGTPSKNSGTSMDKFGDDALTPKQSASPGLASSTKRLVIKPGAHTPKPSMRLRLTMDPNKSDVVPHSNGGLSLLSANGASPSPAKLPAPSTPDTPLRSPPAVRSPRAVRQSDSPADLPAPTEDVNYRHYLDVIRSPSTATDTDGSPANKTTPYAPRLSRDDYEVTPSLNSMTRMTEAELASVSGFSVSRPGFGRIDWEGAVDVRGVDLDTVVNIEDKDIGVYDKEEVEGTKPSQGEKLNRPAILTFLNISPPPTADETAKNKFVRKIEKQTKMMGAELVSYDPETGEWKIRVQHFSRYKFMEVSDSESEDEERPPRAKLRTKSPETLNDSNVGRGGASSEGDSQLRGSPLDIEMRDADANGQSSLPKGKYRELDADELSLQSETDGTGRRMDAVQAANRAYEALFSPPKRDETVDEDPQTEEKQEEEVFFEDDGWDEAPQGSLRDPPAELSLRRRPTSGITSRIAARKGMKIPTSSSTDFGLRMGRSFRVAWRRDGRLIHLGGNGMLVQSRPAISVGDWSTSSFIPALEKHTVKTNSSPTGCGSRALPRFADEPSAVIGTIVGYEEALVGKRFLRNFDGEICLDALELLKGVLKHARKPASSTMMIEAVEESGPSTTELNLGMEALKRWLRRICTNLVKESIRTSAVRPADLIFAAMSTGDLEYGSSVASEQGYHQLAAVIAAFGAGCDDLMNEQIESWRRSGAAQFVPPAILRIYKLLSGDLSIEEQLYAKGDRSVEWQRRLSMLLVFGKLPSGGTYDLKSLLRKYDTDVRANVAPFPASRFSDSSEECLLYRLLRLCPSIAVGRETTKALVDVVSPRGHVKSVHDVSFSFHLSVILSSIGCCLELSNLEKALLYDTYVTQLLGEGSWESAVRVVLTSMDGKTQSWQFESAKSIILMNYDGSNKKQRESLVDNVGVPSVWFAEAVALRALSAGNHYEYAMAVSEISCATAQQTIEDVLLPSISLRNATEASKTLELLAHYGSDPDSLAFAVLDLYELATKIMAMSDMPSSVTSHEVVPLMNTATQLETRFKLHKAQEANRKVGYKLFATTVTKEAFLTEAIAGVQFLRLQLTALGSGASIWEDGPKTYPLPMKLASQLVKAMTTRKTALSFAPQAKAGIF